MAPGARLVPEWMAHPATRPPVSNRPFPCRLARPAIPARCSAGVPGIPRSPRANAAGMDGLPSTAPANHTGDPVRRGYPLTRLSAPAHGDSGPWFSPQRPRFPGCCRLPPSVPGLHPQGDHLRQFHHRLLDPSGQRHCLRSHVCPLLALITTPAVIALPESLARHAGPDGYSMAPGTRLVPEWMAHPATRPPVSNRPFPCRLARPAIPASGSQGCRAQWSRVSE